ncbi:MAG TPA: TlyA family RNA methyltransferase [Patescibacteria group bacterium]|nr:TlyA family RNA methyltransferase [Candidatus Saccharimonadales bacterium]HSX46469.1 TlyA family RNA methyltransferase [Patescibacteria group bacterium]
MPKQRLDQAMVERGLVPTRSQAESYIKLGDVQVNTQTVTKPGFMVQSHDDIKLSVTEQYVSRAGLKLASVAQAFQLSFQDKIVLDVGSSTGGFTDYALQHGAHKVIAVDVGTNQLHPKLREDTRVHLHEKTDIRAFQTKEHIDIAVIDVSFISLREILPAVKRLSGPGTQVIAMVKPQFETGQGNLKHKGVVKNDHMRREILKGFENYVQATFKIVAKADSQVAGAKGNLERFYVLKPL